MLNEGEIGMVQKGDSCVYVRNTDEEIALAWTCRHFARRALDPGSKIDASAPFTPRVPSSKPKLTSDSAARAETALRSAIDYGDGESMMDIAATVVKCYGRFHADLPRLRALTWAARTLGERCCNGDFGAKPSVSHNAALVQQLGVEDMEDDTNESDHSLSASTSADDSQMMLSPHH